MLMTHKGRLARLHYLPATFRVLSHGDHVICAVTHQPIPLAELALLERRAAGGLCVRRGFARGGAERLSIAERSEHVR